MASLKADDSEGLEPSVPFEAPEGLQVVGIFDESARANEAGLAILAMGNAYWTLLHEGCYYLCVAEKKAPAVEVELREFAALGARRRRGAALKLHEFHCGWVSFVLYAAILIACFVLQQRFDLTEVGKSDSVAMMRESTWWRALTALTLHADAVHLVSNLVSGLGFAFFVARFFGAAAGWMLIVLSGIAGNVLNAFVYYPDAHSSIGASTAVFGAVGLLTGIGLWAAFSAPGQRLTLPRWLVPVLGGLTLLGLFGMGEGNVDVAAHISGFICGTVLGFAVAFFQRIFLKLQKVRFWVGALVLLMIVAAWARALQDCGVF